MADAPESGRVIDGRVTTPRKLAHIVLRVRRYEECISWYGVVLGAVAVHSDKLLTFMTYDDEHHRVALVNWPGGSDRPVDAPGLEHVAFTYGSLGDLLNNYVRLKDEGIEPYWTINHGPTISFYYRDPDSNQIELQIDNYPNPDDLLHWFRNSNFRENPIGVNFDPETLVQRYAAGDPLHELIVQGSA